MTVVTIDSAQGLGASQVAPGSQMNNSPLDSWASLIANMEVEPQKERLDIALKVLEDQELRTPRMAAGLDEADINGIPIPDCAAPLPVKSLVRQAIGHATLVARTRELGTNAGIADANARAANGQLSLLAFTAARTLC